MNLTWWVMASMAITMMASMAVSVVVGVGIMRLNQNKIIFKHKKLKKMEKF